MRAEIGITMAMTGAKIMSAPQAKVRTTEVIDLEEMQEQQRSQRHIRDNARGDPGNRGSTRTSTRDSTRNNGHDVSPSRSNSIFGEMDEEGIEYPDGGWKAYSVIIGSFCGMTVCLGLVNAIGAIQSYVSTHQLSHLPASTISWIFSIYLCLTYCSGLLVGSLFDKKGALGILACSTALIFLGLMAAANCTKVWQFILSFMALGFGNGIGLPPLMSVINQWFFKKRGQMVGLSTCGGSVGAIIFTIVLRQLYTEFGFVWAIRTVAFMCLALMLMATALARERITRDPKDKNRSSEDVAVERSFWQKLGHTLNPGDVKDFNYEFIFLVFGGFMGELSLVLIVTYFPSYSIAQGVSESESYLVLTVWNATGILGRWLPGYISDKYGRFNINILMILGLNLCLFVILLPFGGKGLKVLYTFAAFGGFFSSSVLSMLPTCLAQITLANQMGKRYSFVNAILSIGNLVGVPIGASIIGKGSIHGYDMLVVLWGALSFGALIFWGLSRYMIVGSRLNVKV